MSSTPPSPRSLRRKNATLALSILGVAFLVALFPTFCTRMEQPERSYATYAEARAGEPLPAVVPATATEIRVAREADTGAEWVRFNYPATDSAGVVRGLERLTPDAVRRLAPRAPGFRAWWPINPNTFQGKRADRMPVYAVDGGRGGYLAVDPGNHVGFFWRQ
jgi:hypothetical protein